MNSAQRAKERLIAEKQGGSLPSGWDDPKNEATYCPFVDTRCNRLGQLAELKHELTAKDAAIKALMEAEALYRKDLETMANSHVNDYRAACEDAQRTRQGHDCYVVMRKLFAREWNRVARMILGNEYDYTASPHHFPKHEGE